MTLKERITAWLRSRKRDLSSELGEWPAEASKGPDLWPVAAVLALTGFGIVMVSSAGAAFAAKMRIDYDWAYFLKRGRSKNRRNGAANVQVVVEVR
jgi:hypothetical protein